MDYAEALNRWPGSSWEGVCNDPRLPFKGDKRAMLAHARKYLDGDAHSDSSLHLGAAFREHVPQGRQRRAFWERAVDYLEALLTVPSAHEASESATLRIDLDLLARSIGMRGSVEFVLGGRVVGRAT